VTHSKKATLTKFVAAKIFREIQEQANRTAAILANPLNITQDVNANTTYKPISAEVVTSGAFP
jgi:hypothetical protein